MDTTQQAGDSSSASVDHGGIAETADAARDASADELLVQQDSAEDPGLTVIMPTLNEEDGIAECIDRIKSAIGELGVTTEIIISDSSTDRTPEIARELGAIVVEPDEGGYGSAYKYAFERARGKYIAIGDADTTYDFEELPKLVRLATEQDVDMAMGSRLEGEIKPGAMPPLHQYIGNPLLTRFLNAFYDAGVSDAHSGLRVLDREALEQLELRTTGMEFASEMIMDAAAKDMTIAEEPITYHEREGEATLESIPDGWRHVKFMLANAPGYLFTAPAMGLGVLGTLLMALSVTGTGVAGVTFGIEAMLLGSLLTLSGFQIGSLALFSSVAADPIRQPSDPITNWIRRNFELERGATFGLATFCVGALGLIYVAVAATITGSMAVLSPSAVLLAATVTLIGLLTVFSSFFMGMVDGPRRTV
jgi:hypothetical protein